MAIQSAQINELHIHFNLTSKSVDYVVAFNSSNQSLGAVQRTAHDYSFDPTDTDIQSMLTAYQRTPASTAAKLYYKVNEGVGLLPIINTFFETAAAYTAGTAANPTYKTPLQWMIDQNYFLRTHNPTNTEFSDVTAPVTGTTDFEIVSELPDTADDGRMVFLENDINSYIDAVLTAGTSVGNAVGYFRDFGPINSWYEAIRLFAVGATTPSTGVTLEARLFFARAA